MNDQQIEKLLRKGSAVRVPDGLLGKLQANIRQPRSTRAHAGFDARSAWLKRWLPALALTSILLLCVVAVAVQTNIILELKHQKEASRAATGNLEALRAANVEYQRLTAQNQELERLQKDNAELQKLRVEVAQLGGQAQEAQKLRGQIAASQAGLASNLDDDYFTQLAARAEQEHCLENIAQIGRAARNWAIEHDGVYPMNFICLSNGLSSYTTFQCPSDKSHSVSNWSDVAGGNISYELPAPGLRAADAPDGVFVKCPIHHFLWGLDGKLKPEITMVLVPGSYRSIKQVSEGSTSNRVKLEFSIPAPIR